MVQFRNKLYFFNSFNLKLDFFLSSTILNSRTRIKKEIRFKRTKSSINKRRNAFLQILLLIFKFFFFFLKFSIIIFKINVIL